MPELPELQAHAERLGDDFAGAELAGFRPITFTALKTYQPDPWLSDNESTVGAASHAGWRDLVLPAANLWKVHPDIPSEIAAIMDPLGNAVHSALSFDLIGEDVLVCGAGPIGIMAAMVSKMAQAKS